MGDAPSAADTNRSEYLRELAPSGEIRAGINLSNTLLVTGRDATGGPEGIAPDLARAFARHIGAPIKLVPFKSPGDVADQAGNGIWDIALIGAEPQRAETITFSPAYAEIKATYLVPAGSSLSSVSQVDAEGIRIASMARAAYDLWLDRNIRNATLLKAETVEASFERFVSERLDALAGLVPRLSADLPKLPGAKLVEGHFMSVQQAIGTPRGKTLAASAVRDFVEHAKASGMVEQLIRKHGVSGLSVPGVR